MINEKPFKIAVATPSSPTGGAGTQVPQVSVEGSQIGVVVTNPRRRRKKRNALNQKK